MSDRVNHLIIDYYFLIINQNKDLEENKDYINELLTLRKPTDPKHN